MKKAFQCAHYLILQDLIRFLEVAGRLKRISRAGWLEVGVSEPESVADHTYRTAIFCMIYADKKSLDQLKLLQMALIHDLPEAITGDLTPANKRADSEKKENIAITQILNYFPKRQKEKYLRIWKEYKDGKTREAKAVRQLEKLEMALQAKEYEKAKLTKQSLKRFIESAEDAITNPELRRLLLYISTIHFNRK